MENREESGLVRRIDGLEVRIDKLSSEMNHIHHDLVQRIERSETNLLKAFYGYAESTDKRIGNIDANIALFLNRLGTLESRVLAVEKRLNIPPAA